jgi:hypothetical protein
MTRTSLGLLITALFTLGCSAVDSIAQEKFGPHFLFNSGIPGCLTVVDGELLVFDPCNSLPESRVEIIQGFHLDQARSGLRIKLAPDKFLALTVALPDPLRPPDRFLPLKVMASPTGLPSTTWRVTAPNDNGFRSVVAVWEVEVLSFCMNRRSRPGRIADVVVDGCDGTPRWKLDPTPAPF